MPHSSHHPESVLVIIPSLPTGFSICLCSHLSESPAAHTPICLQSLCPSSLPPSLSAFHGHEASIPAHYKNGLLFPFSKNKRSLYFLPVIPVTFSFFPWITWLFLPNALLPVPSCAQFLNVRLFRAQSWTLFLHLSLSWEVFLPDVTQWYLPY